MTKAVSEQFILLEQLKYYEVAYQSSIRLLKALPTGSEGQIHLFSAAKYYRNKIEFLRKELQCL
jgi:hypothetical protein